MCFRRVVWGTGLKIFYVDAMVTLRRRTADYARAFIKNSYVLRVPFDFEDHTEATDARNLLYDPTKTFSSRRYHTYNYMFLNTPTQEYEKRIPSYTSEVRSHINESPSAKYQERSHSARFEDQSPSAKYQGRSHSARFEDQSPSAKYQERSHSARFEDQSPSAKYQGRSHSARFEDQSPSAKYQDHFQNARLDQANYQQRSFIFSRYESFTCDTTTMRYDGHGYKVDIASANKNQYRFHSATNLLVRNNNPLRILYISRGVHGRGRSLGNEQLIIATLRRNGAYVIHFTQSYGRCLKDQLSMAYHADVVTRLHIIYII